MKQYTRSEFESILKRNGWYPDKRNAGNHIIYRKSGVWGNIAIPANRDPNRTITNRLIKEFNLKVGKKDK